MALALQYLTCLQIQTHSSQYVEESSASLRKKISSNIGEHAIVSLGAFSFRDRVLTERITLEEFALKIIQNPKFKVDSIQRYELERNIIAVSRIFPFYDRLYNTALCILAQLTLFDLCKAGTVDVDVENAPIWYALVDDKTLCDRSINTVEDSPRIWTLIESRLNVIIKTKVVFLNQYTDKPVKKSFFLRSIEFSLGQFPWLSGEELSDMASKLPVNCFSLLRNRQLQEMDLSELSSAQLDSLFFGRSALTVTRFELLSLSQMIFIFTKCSLGFISKIPPEVYKSCPLPFLNASRIEMLFIGKRDCFHEIPPKVVARSMKKINNAAVLRLLSQEQFQALSFPDLTSNQVFYLLDSEFFSEGDQLARLRLLSSDQQSEWLHSLGKRHT